MTSAKKPVVNQDLWQRAGRAGRPPQDHLDLDQGPRLARRQQSLRRTGRHGRARAAGQRVKSGLMRSRVRRRARSLRADHWKFSTSIRLRAPGRLCVYRIERVSLFGPGDTARTQARIPDLSDATDFSRRKAKELNRVPTLSRAWNEVDALFRDRNVEIEHGRKHGCFFTALHWDLRKWTRSTARLRSPAFLKAVEILTVRRLDRINRTVPRYLHCPFIATVPMSRHLPDLGLARTIRNEVDPLSVSRKAAPRVIRWPGRYTFRGSALRIDQEHV